MPRSPIATNYVNALFFALMLQLITAQVPVNSTALSSPRKAVASVSIEDRVYFVGGFEFNQKVASDKIEVFNAINQTWMTPLSLPSARGFVTPVVVEPNIYFISGISPDNPPYFYQPSNTSFIQIQSAGPTVREPIELYLFNSTLTVIGSFSVDFYDLNSGNWSYNSNLTAIIMSLTNTRIITYQDYVFVIGGQDMKTNQISTAAWIFNYRTQQLVRHDNITTANRTFESSSYDVSNDVLVLRLNDRCLLYHLLREEWHEELNAIGTVSSFTLNDVTHMLGDNYVMYGWIAPVGGDNDDKFIKMGFVINNTIVYVTEDTLVVVGGQRTSISNFLPTNGPIRFAQLWTPTVYVYADNVRVYVVDIEKQTFDTLLDFTQVTSVFVSDGYLHVFDTTNGATWRKYQPAPTTIAYSLALTSIFAPRVLINGLFVDPAYGTLPTANANDMRPFDRPIVQPFLTTQQDDVFVVMPSTIPANMQRQYRQMDVYNYVNDTWTTKEMPTELFERTSNLLFFRETFMEAAVFNDTIMVWGAGVYGIYNVNSDIWNAFTNVTTPPTGTPPITRPSRLLNLHYQTPVIDGIAYVHHDGLKYFYKFAPDMLTWEETAPTSTETSDSLIIQQPAAYKDTLFVSMRSNDSTITSLYFYDTTLKDWQTTLLPSRSPFVAISVAGDYILAVCSDNKLHIFSIRLGQWNTQELEYEIEPSTIIHVGNVTLIAGGTSLSGLYSDTVLIVSDDVVFIEQPQPAPSNDLPSVVEPPASSSGLTVGELVAAIVVPIAVVIGAGLALLFILLKKRKKSKQTSTTIGLEQQFGKWFTPYDEIEFKEQLGQGANGQVFKGKWKNTDVALKVSMTQANQSVISELSLMINMRPHPNVVQLFGFSVHPETNSVILIIEYCNGGSLDNQLMDENAPVIPINQRLEWLRGIARGVVHLHSNKIVHRDIAARNVLLHQGEPKLTDFGMSRIVDSQQQRGTTKSELGPIRWMSPESLSLKQYSTKSDVWSFGILMYEVIAQQEPHLNADPITTARQIRDEGLTPQVPSSCTPELSSLMKQCWHKTPEQRPTMEEVLQLLEQM